MFFRRLTNTEKFAGGRGAASGVVRTEKRVSGRLRTTKIKSTLGAVLDMSATGVRVSTARKPKVEVGHELRLDLATDEQSMTLPARVVWVRVQHDCSFQIGMEFQQIDSLRKRQIAALLKTAIDCEGLTRGWTPMGEKKPTG